MHLATETMKELFGHYDGTYNVLFHDGVYWVHENVLKRLGDMPGEEFKQTLCERLFLDSKALCPGREDYILGIRDEDLLKPDTLSALYEISPHLWSTEECTSAKEALEKIYGLPIEERVVDGRVMLLIPFSAFPMEIGNDGNVINANYSYYTLEMKSRLSGGEFKIGQIVPIFAPDTHVSHANPEFIAIDKELAEAKQQSDDLVSIASEELQQAIRKRCNRGTLKDPNAIRW